MVFALQGLSVHCVCVMRVLSLHRVCVMQVFECSWWLCQAGVGVFMVFISCSFKGSW